MSRHCIAAAAGTGARAPAVAARRHAVSRAGVTHAILLMSAFPECLPIVCRRSMITSRAPSDAEQRGWERDVSVQRFVRRAPHPAAAAVTSPAVRLRQVAAGWSGQALTWTRSSWVDIAWVAFVAINLLAMRVLPAWQTVPFLAIWVSLTVIYGFRLWRMQPTILTLA